ncbi:MAG: hypothetical protein WC428_01025 [Candidatus Paceibacterota bacterium]
MKNNSTKERLFEVIGRLDKTFKPIEDKTIATTYQLVTPESAEAGDFSDQGWVNQEGESMLPNKYEIEEGITVVDKAVKFLKDNGGTEPSSSQFHVGVWYSTPDPDRDYKYIQTGEEKYYSYHLKGFTLEEEAEIYKKIQEKEKIIPEQQTNMQQSQDVTYTDNTYKVIAPILRRVRTVDQFPLAFKGWFSSLGYNPQSSPLTIAQARIMVEQVMRELGYK